MQLIPTERLPKILLEEQMFKDAAGGVEVSIFFILLKSRQSLETEFRTVSQVHFLVERLVHAKLVSLITFLEEALPKQDTM